MADPPNEQQSPGGYPAEAIGEIPENLYREPLELLYAEHFRALIVCRLLHTISGAIERGEAMEHAATVQSYLESELPIHFADEEADLFPLLRERCRPDDEVENLITLLSEEHKRNGDLAAALAESLGRRVTCKGATNAAEIGENARLFGELQRRHLAWENSLLLPLARRRLTPTDLDRLGRSMAARHDATYPD